MEFLTVKDAAKLLNASERTIYNLVNYGRIPGIQLSIRKILIRRRDLDMIFDSPTFQVKVKDKPTRATQKKLADTTCCYSMQEAQQVFGLSETGLYRAIKRNGLYKFQKGRYTYVLKTDLDKILKGKGYVKS